MRFAIIGLPQCGRTTVWKALSGGHTGHSENIAAVKLPDERLMKIADVVNAKKITQIELEFQDTVGDITHGGTIFSDIQGAFGLIIVLRGFDCGFGTPNPIDDARNIRENLILFDLSATETRINSLNAEIGKPHSKDDRKIIEKNLETLKKFADILNDGKLVGELALDENEKKLARNQGLLTAKKWFAIVNTEDSCESLDMEKFGSILGENISVIPAKFILELAELELDEAKSFMDELDIPKNIIDKTLRDIYEKFGFIEFYTGNEKEARAWSIPKGTIAVDAAGKIHSDIGRGFIRAEIVSWDKFIEAGGYAQARTKAYFRIEGKEYAMQDGDYVAFRFNV
ncbi:DUF933 domain-containing protein [bacterium]|nr:DUF933 domain-containing protein [bacterium]